MSEALHLSRITLKRSPEIGPLIRALQPVDAGKAVDMDHRLIWTVMPEGFQKTHEEKRRAGVAESPFLWRRDDGKGRYYVLGPKPIPHSTLFDIETRPFEAALSPGERLQFVLRVHATVDRRMGDRKSFGRKTERRDVAMDLLYATPKGERAEKRDSLAEKGAREWLEARAAASGFQLDALVLDGYCTMRIDRGQSWNKSKPDQIGVFDLRGLLTVKVPDDFLARLRSGFGRAKVFGCGLMLIRRTA